MSLNTTSLNFFLPAAVVTLLVGVSSYYLYNNIKKKRITIPINWTPVGQVTKIFLYPLKSGHRLELKSAECTNYGLRTTDSAFPFQLRDRSFVVYGESNFEFKTARTFPHMVLIETSVHDQKYVLFDAPNQRSLYVQIPKGEEDCKRIQIKLHQNEKIDGVDCGDEAAVWFSRYIIEKSFGVRLAYHEGKFKRDIRKVHRKILQGFPKIDNEAAGMFSDLSSYLLINEASIDDLNKNLQEAVAANNFRPNILVKGLDGKDIPPYSEENWDWIKIGDAVFRAIKPGTRCILTTVNPDSGIRSLDRQPLKALESLNTLKDPVQINVTGKCPVMGINMGLKQMGSIAEGNTLYISNGSR